MADVENLKQNIINALHKNSIVKFSQLKVLVIESSSGIKKLLRITLQEIGFASNNIVVSNSTNNAENLCRHNEYDLYIVNLNLEDLDQGREFIHKIYEEKLIPTKSVMCILTTENSRAFVLNTLEIKPDEYIIKPFNTEQLKTRLYRAYLKKCELLDIYEAIDEKNYEKIIETCYNHLGATSIYNQDIRLILADAQIYLQRYQDAEMTIREGLNYSNPLIYHIELGKILYLLEEYDEAIKELKIVIEANPLLIEAYKLLFEVYLKQNDLENAGSIMHQAVICSPQSSSLLHMQIEFALQTHDYFTIKESFNSLLDLHKYDPDKLVQLLAGFVQSEIMYVENAPSNFNIDKLSKHVNSVLSRNEQYLKFYHKNFNYKLFKELAKARVDISLNNNPKAKLQLYKILNSYGEELEDQSEAAITNIVLGLWQIGDYELADDLQKNLIHSDQIDPLLVGCVKTYKTDPKINEKKQKYQEYNQQGIKCYKDQKYEEALNFFNEALRKSPANTNANINKAQALIRLAENDNLDPKKRQHYITLCQETLVNLQDMFLGSSQGQRVDLIKSQLDELKSNLINKDRNHKKK